MVFAATAHRIDLSWTTVALNAVTQTSDFGFVIIVSLITSYRHRDPDWFWEVSQQLLTFFPLFLILMTSAQILVVAAVSCYLL